MMIGEEKGTKVYEPDLNGYIINTVAEVDGTLADLRRSAVDNLKIEIWYSVNEM